MYEKCFCYEFDKREIRYIKQPYIPILYDGKLIVDDVDLIKKGIKEIIL